MMTRPRTRKIQRRQSRVPHHNAPFRPWFKLLEPSAVTVGASPARTACAIAPGGSHSGAEPHTHTVTHPHVLELGRGQPTAVGYHAGACCTHLRWTAVGSHRQHEWSLEAWMGHALSGTATAQTGEGERRVWVWGCGTGMDQVHLLSRGVGGERLAPLAVE